MIDARLGTLVVDAAVGVAALAAARARFSSDDAEADGYALALIELDVVRDGRTRRYECARSALIGRSTSATVVLPDPDVSRLHARVELRDGEAVIEDLGSRNGTKVNGTTIRGVTVLAPGDEISIGSWRIVFRGVGGWT